MRDQKEREIREKYLNGEINQWQAYAELMGVARDYLPNMFQRNDHTYRAIYAAETLGRWQNEAEG